MNAADPQADTFQSSRSLLALVEQTANVGVWSLEVATGALDCTRQLARIHDAPVGWQPGLEALLNQYAPEWRDRIRELVAACATRASPFDDEMQIVTFTGRRSWVRTVGQAVCSASGAVIRVEGALQEIAPHTHQPGTLLRHTVSMGGAMGSGEPFATIDKLGRITYFNEQAQALLGHPSRDLTGHPIGSLFQKSVRRELEAEVDGGPRAGS